jgi:hypothetical protein
MAIFALMACKVFGKRQLAKVTKHGPVYHSMAIFALMACKVFGKRQLTKVTKQGWIYNFTI